MAIYISKGKIQAIVNEIGLSNSLGDPTTATGDIVYRDANGDVISLPIGTDGTILTSNGTVPYWAEHIDVSCLASVLFSGATLNATINQRYVMDSNSFATVVALPEAPVDYSWVAFSDWKGNFSANNLTINASGADTIFNGVDTQLVLDTDFQLVTLQYVSGNWSVIGAEAFVDVGGGGGGGLVDITEVKSVAAPNNTVSVVSLTNTAAETNSDIAITPKGTGAFLLEASDGTAAGGNKRGNYAVDLQLFRTLSTQVASGDYSFVVGTSNTVSGARSAAIGSSNTVSAGWSAAIGSGNTTSGVYSLAAGESNTLSGRDGLTVGANNICGGDYAIVGGRQNDVVGDYGIIGGWSNDVDGDYSLVVGQGNATVPNYAYALGYQNTVSSSYSATIGRANTTGANYSVAMGYEAATGSAFGKLAYASGKSVAVGDAQFCIQVLRGITSAAAARLLTTDSSVTATAANSLTPPTDSCYALTVRVAGSRDGAGSWFPGDWEIKALVENEFGTVTIVHQTTTEFNNSMSTATAPVLVVNSNICTVEVTPQSSATTYWVATAQYTQFKVA